MTKMLKKNPTIMANAVTSVKYSIGGLAVVAGGVWIFQGVGILPGSFMTSQIKWAYYGVALAVAGIVLILMAVRRSRSR